MNGTAVTNIKAHNENHVLADDTIVVLNDAKVPDKNNDSNMAKNILLYKNGDKFFPPKRFVVNKRYIRTWDSFLEELTKSIQPRSGAIRDIRTPFHGTRIRSLDDLIINGKYVAVPKGEVMKLIDYTTVIDVTSPSNQNKKEPHRLKPLKPVNNDPEKQEAKSQPGHTKGIIIFVYRNGDPFTRGIKIVLNQFEQKHMSVLVRAIEERVLLPSNRPIRKLYTMEGEIIKFAKDIENGQYYVAASSEQFDNIKYGQYLPVIRAGKVVTRSDQNTDSNRQKPATSRNPKKETNKAVDEKESAAKKIQAAFRGFSIRNAINNAQKNNEPIPQSKYQYEPKKPKPRQEKNNKNQKPLKQTINGNTNETKDNAPKPKERFNPEEKKKEVKETRKEKKPNDTVTSKETIKKEEKKPNDTVTTKETIKKEEKKKEDKKKSENKEKVKKEEKHKTDDQKYNRENVAATIIQANFRGYLVRKSTEKNQVSSKPIKENTSSVTVDKTEKKVMENGNREVIENKSEEKQSDKDIDKEKERTKAAITIQMGFKGYKTRKDLKEREIAKKKEKAVRVIHAGYKGYKVRKLLKEKLDKENREMAAIKIQAGYRGFRVRKAAAEKLASVRNNAVTKIQAGFRGYKARSSVKP